MKKGLILGLILTVLISTAVFAAAYSATITVTETEGSDRSQQQISLSVNNTGLASDGFILPSGLDTRVLSAGTELPHMVADDKTLFVANLLANLQHTYSYTTGSDNLSSFPITVGHSGNITVVDHSTLDMEGSFIWDIKGWINTDNGSGKNIVYREDSFIIYISAEDSIRAAILSAGDVEDLAVTATGITSGVRRVVVEADGFDFTISVYDADDVLIDDATTPLGANSVPDSGNSWSMLQNNVMPYAEYIKLSTSE